MSIKIIEGFIDVLHKEIEEEKQIQLEIDKLIDELKLRFEQEPKFDLNESLPLYPQIIFKPLFNYVIKYFIKKYILDYFIFLLIKFIKYIKIIIKYFKKDKEILNLNLNNKCKYHSIIYIKKIINYFQSLS